VAGAGIRRLAGPGHPAAPTSGLTQSRLDLHGTAQPARAAPFFGPRFEKFLYFTRSPARRCGEKQYLSGILSNCFCCMPLEKSPRAIIVTLLKKSRMSLSVSMFMDIFIMIAVIFTHYFLFLSHISVILVITMQNLSPL
jgi:hypothetical protein